MQQSFWLSVATIPWWIYTLFFYFLWIGYLASKPRIVQLKRLFLFPTIFLILSMISLLTAPVLPMRGIVFWMFAMLIGAGIGWLQFKLLKIKAVPNRAALYIPGTWSVLILILLFFISRFYFRYELSVDISDINKPSFIQWLMLIYGLFTGLLIGRLSYSLRCMRKGPYYSAC